MLSIVVIYVQLILGGMFRHHGMSWWPHVAHAAVVAFVFDLDGNSGLVGLFQHRGDSRTGDSDALPADRAACLGFAAFLTRVAWGRDSVQPELPMVILDRRARGRRRVYCWLLRLVLTILDLATRARRLCRTHSGRRTDTPSRMSAASQFWNVPSRAALAVLARDYAELTKLRVTTLVVLDRMVRVPFRLLKAGIRFRFVGLVSRPARHRTGVPGEPPL